MKRDSSLSLSNHVPNTSLETLSHLAGQNFGSTNEATSAILTTISDVLGMRTSWVSHVDQASGTLDVISVHNKPDGCNVQLATAAPLPATFCSLAINASGSGPLVIEDVRNNPEFAQTVAARSFPNIGAYIGVPICLSDGTTYGTLCASDPDPHPVTPDQAKLLAVLSRMLATQFERDREIDARRMAEDRFTAFMDHSPLVAYMKDGIGRYVYINKPFERTFSIERNWLMGKTDQDWLDAETATEVQDHDRQVIASQSSQQFIETVHQSDGTDRHYYSYKFPVVDPSGQTFIGGASADITERRARELERAYLASIVNNSSDAIYGRNLDGQVTSWNPSAERLFGYTAEEMVGQSLDILLPPDFPNDQLLLTERLRAGEHTQNYETRRQTKTGQVLDVALSLSPIRDANGDIVGGSTVARDVTAHNLLLAERNQLMAELQEEMSRAANVQTHLLPRTVPQLPGYEFAATCIPARDVGGDFFDWGGTADTVRITLGDVSGKGMPAALLMATARAALRAATQLPVGEAVNAVNRALLEDLEQFDAFITMFHVELSASGELTYVDAGHGLALILRADGTMTTPPTGQVPIGILPDMAYATRLDHLAPGDTLVMYSDGLADARPDLVLENPANFNALCHEGANALQTLEHTVDAVDVHRSLPDDLTIVLVHRQA